MWEKKDTNNPAPNNPVSRPAPPASTGTPSSAGGPIVNLGQSIRVKGELSGNEDLTVDGHVEGKISLKDHNLTIGQHGRIEAEVVARTVTILGRLQGNVIASEKVDIQKGGRLDGDITSPRVAIADGAHFRGKVDMEAKRAEGVRKPPATQTQGGAG